jgi:hypothetical protein
MPEHSDFTHVQGFENTGIAQCTCVQGFKSKGIELVINLVINDSNTQGLHWYSRIPEHGVGTHA